eukprot:GDKK01036206.1.p1 GENE.GDKK01036206.1~~GDKK01036206.1.p1  ORF type:complete len:422 (-),score=31.49 GDKK01036206.1:102-1367(-)
MEFVEMTKNDSTAPEDVRVLPVESIRFDITDPEQEEAMLRHLDECGYAVVASVAVEEQVELGINMFWDFWEKAAVRGPIKRHDLESYKHWMGNAATGILVGAKENHNDFAWTTRTLPLVKKAFAKIWQDEDLVVSFDASGAFRPYKPHKEWLTNGGWWHVDQNHLRGKHRQGRVTVQGLVTYYDANAETGGLCLIPGSHLHHQAVCERAPTAKMDIDYVSIPRNDPVLTSEQAILVCAKAGDLILWDSRTVHCNTCALAEVDHFKNILKAIDKKRGPNDPLPSLSPDAGPTPNTETAATISASTTAAAAGAGASAPEETTTTLASNTVPFAPKAELIRLVSYVCMVPRAHTTSTTMYNRKQAFVHKRPTSHYPSCEYCVSTERAMPWTKRRDILQLVGYTEREIDTIQAGRDPEGFGCSIS